MATPKSEAKPTPPKVETKLVENLRELTDWTEFCQSTSKALANGKLTPSDADGLISEWTDGPEAWKDFVEDQAKPAGKVLINVPATEEIKIEISKLADVFRSDLTEER